MIPQIKETDSSELFGKGKIPLLQVNTADCSAIISLQGAQLLSFKPKSNGREMLWLSADQEWESGAAMRGGIPICGPWFGVNRHQANQPKHGFLRNRLWQLLSCVETNGKLALEFEYCSDDADIGLFPQSFVATLSLQLSDRIELSINIQNTAAEAMPLSWAAHSYFAVADASRAEIFGLEGRDYLDNTEQLLLKRQRQSVQFGSEVDRVFCDVDEQQRLIADDTVEVSGDAPTAIVWNPGKLLASEMPDVGSGYKHFICLERGLAFADELLLAPGEHYSSQLSMGYA